MTRLRIAKEDPLLIRADHGAIDKLRSYTDSVKAIMFLMGFYGDETL